MRRSGRTTLVIRGLEPPRLPEAAGVAAADAEVSAGPNAEETKASAQRLGIAAGAHAVLSVEVALPEGYHLNPSAPNRYQIEVVGLKGVPTNLALLRPDLASALQSSGGRPEDAVLSVKSKLLGLPLRVPLDPLSPGAAELRVALTVYYCREDNTGTCRVKTLVWRAPVEVTDAPDAPREVRLKGKVE